MSYQCYRCSSSEIRLVSTVWEQNRRSVRLFGVPVVTMTTEFGYALRPPGFMDRVLNLIINKDADLSHRLWREDYVCLGCGTRACKMLFMNADDWTRAQENHYRQDKESASRLKTANDKLLVEPANTMARMDLSQEHLRRGEYLEALQHAEEAVKQSPTDTRAWMKLGNACSHLGYLERAEEAYSASAEHGNRANALAERGHVRARLGCKKAAQSDFVDAYLSNRNSWNISPEEVRQLARSVGVCI